jgi:hypothetical protein
MCARFFYLILAALVTFNVVTIVAFIYLPWWQALIAVVATVFAMVLAGKYLIRYFFRSMLQMSAEAMAQHGKVLKNASLTVHSVRPAEMPQEVRELFDEATNEDADPAELAEAQRTYERLVWRQFEVSIFPDSSQLQPGDNPSWEPTSLCLVPMTWKYEDEFDLDDERDDDGSIAIYQIEVIVDGQVVEPDYENGISGVQRIRFVAGVGRELTEVAMAYMSEKFGTIKLPSSLPPRRPS